MAQATEPRSIAIRVVVVCLVLATLYMPDIQASLNRMPLSGLIKASDVIVLGRVVRSETSADGGGVAVVEIRRIYKGAAPGPRLSITWTGSDEDQAIDRVNSDGIFFLRSYEKAGLVPTQFGRSYWPVRIDLKTHGLVAPYTDPLTIIELDMPGLLTTGSIYLAEIPRHRNPIEVPVIPVDRLQAAIEGLGGSVKR